MASQFATLGVGARRMGQVEFGYLALGMSATALAATIIEYSFNWTGTAAAAGLKEDQYALASLFREVTAAKCLIAATLSVPTFFITILFPTGGPLMWLACIPAAIAAAITPLWYLRGIGNLLPLLIATLATRAGLIVTIWLIPAASASATSLLFTFGMAQLALSVGLFFNLARANIVGKDVPNVKAVLRHLTTDFPVFLGTVAVSLYTSSQPLIVGAIGGPAQSALYLAADKIVALPKIIMSLASQAIFPLVAARVHQTERSGLNLIAAVMPIFLFSGILFSVLVWIFAPSILMLAFGPNLEHAAPVLRALSLSLAILGLSTMTAMFLMNFGLRRSWSVFVMLGGLVSLSTTVLAANFGNESSLAAAIGQVCSELAILILSLLSVWRAVQTRGMLRTTA